MILVDESVVVTIHREDTKICPGLYIPVFRSNIPLAGGGVGGVAVRVVTSNL